MAIKRYREILNEAQIDKVKDAFDGKAAFAVVDPKFKESVVVKGPGKPAEKILKKLGVKFKSNFTGKDKDGNHTWGFKDEFDVVAFWSDRMHRLYIVKGAATNSSDKYEISNKAI